MRRARFEDLEGNQRNEQPNPMSIDQGHLVLTDHSLVVQPPSSLSRQRSLHKREDGTLEERLHKPFLTNFLIFANIACFIYTMYRAEWKFEELSINPLLGPPTKVLLECGAKDTNLIVIKGQIWRLPASMFLHGGIAHLVLNMIGVNSVAKPLEEDFGPWRLLLCYLFSGLFGAIMSSLFLPNIIGVGASGALFGMLGATWADLLQNWSFTPEPFKTLFFLLFGTIINLAFGLLPLLDNFAHVFGFLGGVMTGMVFLIKPRYASDGSEKPISSTQSTISYIFAAIAFISSITGIVMLFTGFDPHEWCSWCSYLNCIDTSLWSCTSGQCDILQYSNRSNLITCYDGSQHWTQSMFNKRDPEELREWCSTLC